MAYGTVRRIGNSLGVIIPRQEALRQGLREGDAVEVTVHKARRLDELYGLLKGKLGSIEELNKLVDEGEDLG